MTDIENSNLYQLARSGELDEIEDCVFDSDISMEEQQVLLYQWGLIAEDFGHSEASETWREFLEIGGDETLAAVQYEVGIWYLLGEHGIEKDVEKAYYHLTYVVEQYKILDILDLETDLTRVCSLLEGDDLARFSVLFDQNNNWNSN